MTRQNQTLYILNPDCSHLDLEDALSERLTKAKSLAQFALTESMLEHLNKDFQNYLWALNQFIQEACEINHAINAYFLK